MFDLRCIIGGEPVECPVELEVINPAYGKSLALAPLCSEVHVNSAVASALSAASGWASLPIDVRANYIEKVAGLLESSASVIAELTVAEQGKPKSQAIGEVMGAAAWARATAKLRVEPELLRDLPDGRVSLHKRPIGVVASITPWNHPIIIAAWHILPALLAGNTVVVKPSEYTPLGTLKMVELINGLLPAGVLNSVSGGAEVGRLLAAHPGVAKIAFTGSTTTGRAIMREAAGNLKRLTLELGGNDAAIVLGDADVDRSSTEIFQKAFGNSGQTCAAIKRLYVHDSVHDRLVSKLVQLANKACLGPGHEEASEFGPIQNRKQFEFVCDLAEDAVRKGASFDAGGKPLDRCGFFFPLSVLTGAKKGMRVVDEEQFGPILPVVKFSDVEDAIAQANASDSGLGGSVWSANEARAMEIAARLECGTAWINTHSALAPDIPFGGAKQSGLGVAFGRWGFEENMQHQVLHAERKVLA